MKKQKIIAIVGSIRQNSLNLQLAKEAGRLIGEQADFELLEFTDVPFFNQDIEYPAPDSVTRVRNKVKEADAIWFFCPEYNHSFPGVLKNLIDWLSRPISENEPQVLKGKPAAVSGISLGMSGGVVAQDSLVSLISMLNMKIMNQPRLSIPNAWQQTDTDGKLILTDSLSHLEKQVKAFLCFIV